MKGKLFKSMTVGMREAIHRLEALGISVEVKEYKGAPIPVNLTQADCDFGKEHPRQNGLCAIAHAMKEGHSIPVYYATVGPKISYLLLVDGVLSKVWNMKDAQKIIGSTDTPGLIPEPGIVHFSALPKSATHAAYTKKAKELSKSGSKGSHKGRGIYEHRPRRQRDISPRSFYSKAMNAALSKIVESLKQGKAVSSFS